MFNDIWPIWDIDDDWFIFFGVEDSDFSVICVDVGGIGVGWLGMVFEPISDIVDAVSYHLCGVFLDH